jgi:hypothetical protein
LTSGWEKTGPAVIRKITNNARLFAVLIKLFRKELPDCFWPAMKGFSEIIAKV